MAKEAATYFQGRHIDAPENLSKWLRLECGGCAETWRIVSRPVLLDSEDALDKIVFDDGPGLLQLHVFARVSFRAGAAAKGLHFDYEGETWDLPGE